MLKLLRPNLGHIRQFTTNRSFFIDTINNFTKHNMKYIKKFDLSIRNPNDLSFIYPAVYEGTIWFDKGNMRIIKEFKNNNIEQLMNEVSEFISKEIKI